MKNHQKKLRQLVSKNSHDVAVVDYGNNSKQVSLLQLLLLFLLFSFRCCHNLTVASKVHRVEYSFASSRYIQYYKLIYTYTYVCMLD